MKWKAILLASVMFTGAALTGCGEINPPVTGDGKQTPGHIRENDKEHETANYDKPPPASPAAARERQQDDTTIPPEDFITGTPEPAVEHEIGSENGTEVKIIVSGQDQSGFINKLKQAPVIKDGEVLVPISAHVFEFLVDLDGNNAGFYAVLGFDSIESVYLAVIANDLYDVRVFEGEYSFACNNETVPLAVPAQRINDELMLPLKAIAEAIGATVECAKSRHLSEAGS